MELSLESTNSPPFVPFSISTSRYYFPAVVEVMKSHYISSNSSNVFFNNSINLFKLSTNWMIAILYKYNCIYPIIIHLSNLTIVHFDHTQTRYLSPTKISLHYLKKPWIQYLCFKHNADHLPYHLFCKY